MGECRADVQGQTETSNSTDELIKLAETLRESPTGYPADSSQQNFGPALFNIGVEVAQTIFGNLNPRLKKLRQEYEVDDSQVIEPETQHVPGEIAEAERQAQLFFDTRMDSQNCDDDRDCVLLPFIACINPCSQMAVNGSSVERLLSMGEKYNLIDPQNRPCAMAACPTSRPFARCISGTCETSYEPRAGDPDS